MSGMGSLSMVKDRKGIFALGVSLIAMSAVSPAWAADVAITADATAATTATSAPTTEAGDEVVVTGIRASIQASLDQKRKSDMVSEVLTAQDIGKFPDKNVADSLGRLTGVNVVTGSAAAGGFGENQNISIRGTDPSAQPDSARRPFGCDRRLVRARPAESGGRSFDFSLLPSEIVGSLEVFKSSEADLQEGGIGGTVNLHSRKPLDLPKGTDLADTAQMDLQRSGRTSGRLRPLVWSAGRMMPARSACSLPASSRSVTSVATVRNS